MVLGLPGVGKSYFARQFALAIQGVHINSDLIRKKTFEQPIYSSEEKSRVYAAMFESVSQLLGEGKRVVVDATFSKQDRRLPYYHYTEKEKIDCKLIRIVADEDMVKERLKVTRPDSDADFEIYRKIKKEYEVLDRPCLVLDSTKLSVGEMIEKAKEYVGFTAPK